ncbi:hypothetical protein Fcan01_27509 [Folsomia candida]|uniref:Uncharacterized protein n=1 Tax=Folsomia candida TaxID=158441 RepID=A0A226CY56_FOLCA|nr:hypothetical protein Fcan01_27509 [Folsomia candida]
MLIVFLFVARQFFHLLVASLTLLAFSWSACQAQSTCTQCTANGTQSCPADKFPRNTASTYEINCRDGPSILDPNYAEGREQRGTARLCKADRYREECNCVPEGAGTCRTDAACTEILQCGSGTISRCDKFIEGFEYCTSCRAECNSDLECSFLNCTGNTPYKKCAQNVCQCVECLQTSQCPDCTGFSKKLCRKIGDPKNTCACLNPYGVRKKNVSTIM